MDSPSWNYHYYEGNQWKVYRVVLDVGAMIIQDSDKSAKPFGDRIPVDSPTFAEVHRMARMKLDPRHPRATLDIRAIGIALNPNKTLRGCPTWVTIAMKGFIGGTGPALARQQIQDGTAVEMISICGSIEQTLAVCDHCIKQFFHVPSLS